MSGKRNSKQRWDAEPSKNRMVSGKDGIKNLWRHATPKAESNAKKNKGLSSGLAAAGNNAMHQAMLSSHMFTLHIQYHQLRQAPAWPWQK